MFVLNHLDLLSSNDIDRSAADIGRALWTRDPEAVVKLLHEPSPRRLVAEKGLGQIPEADLIQGLRCSHQSIAAVLERRPELTEECGLWSIPGPWSQDGLNVVYSRPERAEAALTAMLAAKRDDLASEVVRRFGHAKVLRAICGWAHRSTIETHAETLSAWLAASVHDAEALAEVMSVNHIANRAFLFLIARSTYPDFVPNDFGDDPWWTSVHHAGGSLDDRQQQYLAAYSLARALGYRSRNQAELFEFAFDDIYIPASQSRLSVEAWNLIAPRLPKPWFVDWDYCQRLRDGLVDTFVDRDLWPGAFVRVTRHDDIFEQLTRVAARTGRGRRFLKKALHVLMELDQWSRRVDVLRDAI